MKLKNFLTVIAMIAYFAGVSLTANAATINANAAVTARQQNVWHFKSRAAAAEKLRQLQSRGHVASMFKNLRGWSVTTLGVDGSTSGRTTRVGRNGTRTTTTTTTTTVSGLPRGANVTYFPDRSTANAIYRSALRQGDWAKMWDAGSRGWAVAIKVR